MLAMAGGLFAVPGAIASAAPPSTTCDGADCVPYVYRGVAEGGHCLGGTRWVYGLDASGNTLRCGTPNTWRASGPLVGIRTNSSSCEGENGVAQSPDGLPLSCLEGRWRHDFRATFF